MQIIQTVRGVIADVVLGKIIVQRLYNEQWIDLSIEGTVRALLFAYTNLDMEFNSVSGFRIKPKSRSIQYSFEIEEEKYATFIGALVKISNEYGAKIIFAK